MAGPIRQVPVVVIGGGHAGLAMSRCLTDRSIDHVVLERGEVANTWKTERWDSLRLLTPNWQCRLPGYAYSGDRPDDFMAVSELVAFIEAYAEEISAPVISQTTVESVRPEQTGYTIETDQGSWAARTVVLANGAFGKAHVPAVAGSVPEDIRQLTPVEYRNPSGLGTGGVLVVGASATGIQLADEIQRSGRAVTVAVGEHVRLPRIYRGRDIQWWMDAAGVLDERYDEVDDIVRARRVPSPQLVGTSDRATLDLNSLTDRGAKLVGRLAGVNDGNAQFSGSLPNVCALADLKQVRLLDRIDEWASEAGLDSEVNVRERFRETVVDDAPSLGIDLKSGEIETILWATGFRPDYSWLDMPILDHKGQVRHDGGVVDAPGMYLLGSTFLRRRKSSFIHGAGDDASDLAEHLVGFLDGDRDGALA